jgi:hypothetical protein
MGETEKLISGLLFPRAKIFSQRMEAARIPDLDRQQYLKWLRFYLDFYEKCKHSPTHPDSLGHLLHGKPVANEERGR